MLFNFPQRSLLVSTADCSSHLLLRLQGALRALLERAMWTPSRLHHPSTPPPGLATQPVPSRLWRSSQTTTSLLTLLAAARNELIPTSCRVARTGRVIVVVVAVTGTTIALLTPRGHPLSRDQALRRATLGEYRLGPVASPEEGAAFRSVSL